MTRWGKGAAVLAALVVIGGCSTTTAGRAVPAPGAAGGGPATTTSSAVAGSGWTAGTATVKLDGVVPPGADRIAMQCRIAAGSVVANPTDVLSAPQFAPVVTIRTDGTPRAETVMFSVKLGVLLGDRPFTTAVDGATYVVTGTASGLTGSVDDGSLAQVKRSFEIRLTCPS